jgi:hypothetical protein
MVSAIVGQCESLQERTSPAPSFLARSILMPCGAATTTLQPPFCRSIWARLFLFSVEQVLSLLAETYTNPVGPAPNIKTDEPILGEILSKPWAAHDAGSNYMVSDISSCLWIHITYKSGINIREVMYLKDFCSRIGAVLGEATICKILVTLQ